MITSTLDLIQGLFHFLAEHYHHLVVYFATM